MVSTHTGNQLILLQRRGLTDSVLKPAAPARTQLPDPSLMFDRPPDPSSLPPPNPPTPPQQPAGRPSLLRQRGVCAGCARRQDPGRSPPSRPAPGLPGTHDAAPRVEARPRAQAHARLPAQPAVGMLVGLTACPAPACHALHTCRAACLHAPEHADRWPLACTGEHHAWGEHDRRGCLSQYFEALDVTTQPD